MTMFQSQARKSLTALLVLVSLFGAWGCGSDGSPGSGGIAGQGGFQLTLITVPAGETEWQINRPIEFHFNDDVDFSSVNLNSIQIREQDGSPATGEFTLKEVVLPSGEKVVLRDVVVFRPTCPKLPSPFPDAGLKPNGTTYTIRVVGQNTGGGITVRSSSDRPLATGQVRTFRTPIGFDELAIFQDIAVGPPQAVVRGAAGVAATEEVATHLEIGTAGGAASRVYFSFNPTTLTYDTISEVPLNLYSVNSSKVAVNLVINQPVDPSPTNITPERVGVQFLNSEGVWQEVPIKVELTANCTEAGALVRLEPIGILPPTSSLRVFLSSDFRDIRGDFNLLPVNNFGPMETTELNNPAFTPPNETADELLETFAVGGTSFGSFEDTDAAFLEQRANWGPDGLRPAFGFNGTGGPDPDMPFDLTFTEDFVLDTNNATLTSADNQQTVPVFPRLIPGTNRRVLELNVRNFTIAAGKTVRLSGPNSVRILATGDVTINGVLDASGFKANNVQSLNLATVPQSGGVGIGGGGDGGIGSPLSSSSSPRGGFGQGPYRVAGAGGGGGESGYSGLNQRNSWRPGGGGGGRFGPNEGTLPNPSQPGNGLVAQRGFDGMDSTQQAFTDLNVQVNGSFGAETDVIPAKGGVPGSSPFLDASDENNFWGVALNGGNPIRGELANPLAGAGGGGGGDAINSPTFPTPVFQDPSNNNLTTRDYKGGGGGGGGGSLHVLALGDIRFGVGGRIICNGGRGGTGESTFFIDRVGGGGGGGSGGHVILETRGVFDVSAKTTGQAVEALGGSGGLGMPTGANEEGTDEFIVFNQVLQRRVNEGGTGGPGIVQIHLTGDTLAQQKAKIMTPPGKQIEQVITPDPLLMVPSFGSRSRAQSDWIALGGASPASGASDEAVVFRFGGTDMDGFVLDANDDEIVDALPPILSGTLSSVDAGSSSVAFSTAGIAPADDIYLRNPKLLEGFDLELTSLSASETYVVADASFSSGVLTLELVTPTGGTILSSFFPGDGFDLVPRFFKVTNLDPSLDIPIETMDQLPMNSSIQILFQGTGITPDGDPDPTVLVDWTGDITELNGLDSLAFFRFGVLIDIAADGSDFDSNSLQPYLNFLRVPFRFQAALPAPE